MAAPRTGAHPGEEAMGRHRRGIGVGGMVVAAALAQILAVSPLHAQEKQQGKTTITFAGVTFSEAGRGDKLKAWVEKFNKSQDKIEVQPIGLPFAVFANTMFTQMGGGGGPDLVRFDTIDFYVAVPAGRILPFDDHIKDS